MMSMSYGCLSAFLCIIICVCTPASAETFSVYFVGNSVTDQINYGGLDAMAEAQGHTHLWGRDMIPGAPLEWLWNHPADGFQEPPYGLYPNALPNYEWDAISLQPFDRLLDNDVNYAGRFIDLALSNPANADCQFYIYSRWPRKNSDGTLDYDALWLREYTGGWDNTNETRDYFETLTYALRDKYPALAKPILMVPAGDVLYELNQRMKAGQVPGFTDVCDVYADGIHFNNIGQYVVGTTYYATLYKEDPAGLAVPPDYGTIVPAVVAQIQDAVWDVVNGHTLSGVVRKGDFEPDGDVDLTDLVFFTDRWPFSDCNDANDFCGGADLNKDSRVFFDDFALLAQNWRLVPYSP